MDMIYYHHNRYIKYISNFEMNYIDYFRKGGYNMSCDMLKMKMIFTNDDMDRITENDTGYVVDLHGKHRYEARAFINNIIKLTNHPFTIVLIHGYNNGTVLKKMIFEDQINSRIINKTEAEYNMGRTLLTVA